MAAMWCAISSGSSLKQGGAKAFAIVVTAVATEIAASPPPCANVEARLSTPFETRHLGFCVLGTGIGPLVALPAWLVHVQRGLVSCVALHCSAIQLGPTSSV